jgi:hypothetical protein
MEAHLALQARVHDYEDRDREKAFERGTEVDLRTDPRIRIKDEDLAEKDVVNGNEKQIVSGHDDGMKTVSAEEDDVAVTSGSSDEDTVAMRNEDAKDKAAATAVEDSTACADNGKSQGGHTPGEVWTESPHFLWGP